MSRRKEDCRAVSMTGWLRVIASALALLSQANAASAGSLYRCSAVDYVTFADDGTFGRYPSDYWKIYWTNVLIDTDSGIVRRKGHEPEHWNIVQQGSPDYDFVAYFGTTLPPHLAFGKADILGVRAWKTQTQVTFMVLTLTMIVTGRCDRINP